MGNPYYNVQRGGNYDEAVDGAFATVKEEITSLGTSKAPAEHIHAEGTPFVVGRGTTLDAPAPSSHYLYINTTNGHTERRDGAGALVDTMAARDWLAPAALPSMQNDDQDPWTDDYDWGCPRAEAGLAAWGWASFRPWLADVDWRVSLQALLATSRSTANLAYAHTNCNPTATTGITKGGDAAATLTVVDDSAALAAAGLSWLCTNGKVFKLDNSAGSTLATAEFQHPSKSLVPHSLSAWLRYGGSGAGVYMCWGADLIALHTPITHADYRRVKAENKTPPSVGTAFMVAAPAGSIAYFVLVQLEVGATATHEVLTAGAAATSGPRLGLNLAYQINPAATPVKARWQPSTVYGLGDLVIPTTPNGHYYECTTGGTSGATPPTWPTSSTVADNSVVWTRAGDGLNHLGNITVMPTTALEPADIDTDDLQIPAAECAPGDLVVVGIWRAAGAAFDDAILAQIAVGPVEV